jgi:F0F1-type ATP synthase assembly protein I
VTRLRSVFLAGVLVGAVLGALAQYGLTRMFELTH